MIGTIEAIQRELTHDGFVFRYASDTATAIDGLPAGEAAFLPCTFWLADNLAPARADLEARGIFERVIGVATTSGCCRRSTTSSAKRLVGNFPRRSRT